MRKGLRNFISNGLAEKKEKVFEKKSFFPTN